MGSIRTWSLALIAGIFVIDFTAVNTGSGVGMLVVRYVQGCNSAQSA